MSKQPSIKDLEEFFATVELPTEPVSLGRREVCVIKDAKKFVTTHLSYLENNSGKRYFLPYYNRLRDFKNYLENEKQKP